MRLAAIDIGTNTILMVVADLDKDGTLSVVRDEHIIARLGKGVDEHRTILPETFDRVLKVLSDYKKISDECGSERIIACGTSALRDARNRGDFIAFIEERLGFRIRVLSGDEEAGLTYLGAASDLVEPGKSQGFAVVDIGGGSTELTLGINLSAASRTSMDLGSVRITERFFGPSPPSEGEIGRALSFIHSQTSGITPFETHTRAIGVAGTLTTLAALDLDLPAFDRARVHGHRLSFAAVGSIFDRLRTKSLEELRRIPQILPQRADIILAGIMILMEMMKRMSLSEITVSDRGLRFGILLKEEPQGSSQPPPILKGGSRGI